MSGVTAEGDSVWAMDFGSNFFKPRASSQSVNDSGTYYIYLAFAEAPFGGAGITQARAAR